MYTILYLPVAKPVEDGCTLIDQNGDHFTYDETVHLNLKYFRVAELFLVHEEYNEKKIVGTLSPEALKWVMPGMQIKPADCETWYYDIMDRLIISKKDPRAREEKLAPGRVIEVIRIKCPICNHKH